MALVKYNNNSISAVTATGLASGALTHIKTLTADNSANLSFVHGSDGVILDSTYPIYQFILVTPSIRSNTNKLGFNVSIDGGSNYNVAKTSTAFRAYHGENGSGGVLQYYGDDDLAQGTGLQPIHHGGNSDSDSCVSGDMFLFNPSSTTFATHFISDVQGSYGATYSINHKVAGYCNNTAAINAVQFTFSSGNIDAGDICLYGIV